MAGDAREQVIRTYVWVLPGLYRILRDFERQH